MNDGNMTNDGSLTQGSTPGTSAPAVGAGAVNTGVTQQVGVGTSAPGTGTGVTQQAGAGTGAPGASVPGTSAPENGASVLNPSAAGAPGTSAGPESYEPFALPEGMEASAPDVAAALSDATGVFRELGLTQEQGQKLVDLYGKHWIGAVDAFDLELSRRMQEWGEEIQRDPELGGARLKESVTHVRRAIWNLGGAELEAALEQTGAINHPQIFRAFVRMGRGLAEDTFVTGQVAGGAPDSPEAMAARVYPNMARR